MIQPCVRCGKPLHIPGIYARPYYKHGAGTQGSVNRPFLGYRCDPGCVPARRKVRHPKLKSNLTRGKHDAERTPGP